MSRDVIWQPGPVAEESITATADGLGDGRETGGRGERITVDKLVPFDLQQLSLALHTLITSRLYQWRQVNDRKRKRNSWAREWITAQRQSEKLTKNRDGLHPEN